MHCDLHMLFVRPPCFSSIVKLLSFADVFLFQRARIWVGCWTYHGVLAHDVLLVLCWLVTANAGLHLTLMVEVHSTGKSLLGRGKFDYSRKNRQTKHTCPQGFLFAISFNFIKEFNLSRRGLLGKIFDKLRIQGRMQIFEKKSQKALNHVLIG